jgi:hypothetical protein
MTLKYSSIWKQLRNLVCSEIKEKYWYNQDLSTIIKLRTYNSPIFQNNKDQNMQNYNFVSCFVWLGPLSKESVHVRGFLWMFVTNLFFTVRSC